MGALVSALVSIVWSAAQAVASVVEYGVGACGAIGT